MTKQFFLFLKMIQECCRHGYKMYLSLLILFESHPGQINRKYGGWFPMRFENNRKKELILNFSVACSMPQNKMKNEFWSTLLMKT